MKQKNLSDKGDFFPNVLAILFSRVKIELPLAIIKVPNNCLPEVAKVCMIFFLIYLDGISFLVEGSSWIE